MILIPALWVSVDANVLFSRAVAGFTGDPELRHLGIHFRVACNVGLGMRGVTLVAGEVPPPLQTPSEIRRDEKRFPEQPTGPFHLLILSLGKAHVK